MQREIKSKSDKKALVGMYRAEKFRCLALLFVPIFALIAVVGCATEQAVRLPAVALNPSGEVYVGKFVWIDLLTEDVAVLSDSTGAVFGIQMMR